MATLSNLEKTEREAQTSTDEATPPPPAYSELDGASIFEVHYADWQTHIDIVDASGVTLFRTEREQASTKLDVVDAHDRIVGHCKSSSWTSKIDVEIFHGEGEKSYTYQIRNHSTFGAPEYASPAFDGKQLTWKGKFLTRKILYEVMDEAGKLYARFESDPKTKIGHFQLINECLSADRLQEIMVTLLSLFVRKLKNANDVPQYGVVN